jgi:magnesium chelatase family protein
LEPEVGHGKKATRECPCGFFTDPQKECGCTPPQIQRYRSKVSGPLLDRIDIQVEVPALRYQDLASKDAGEPSSAILVRESMPRGKSSSRVFRKKISTPTRRWARETSRNITP